MRVTRRAFLLGGASVLGGGVFALRWLHSRAADAAERLTTGAGEGSFAGWLKIGADDTITVYSPHIDFGQGTHTALAQMLADELDADWSRVRVEQAPAESAFANTALGKGFTIGDFPIPAALTGTVDAAFSMVARRIHLQTTGGSTAIRFTGQYGMRVIGAAARQALLTTAAARLGVPAGELVAAKSIITHTPTGKTLRYGELAADAGARAMSAAPTLKTREQFTLIGKAIDRFDIPGKVDGSAKYGIDLKLPDMRVATIHASPVHGGTLTSVDPAPAMAVEGVERVIRLPNAVAVVGRGYWPALQGLRALRPVFADGGAATVTTASIFAAQDAARATKKPAHTIDVGNVDRALAEPGVQLIEARYQVPFLQQAQMEPLALTAHLQNGTLHLWGGLQDPIAARFIAAEAAGLDPDNVVFHTTIMGGGFGRRFPAACTIIGQVVAIAMQVPYPVKLIWSREEDVAQGSYRPQVSAVLRAAVSSSKQVTAWQSAYVQGGDAGGEARTPYLFPNLSLQHFSHASHVITGPWRSVDASQHGFFNESFVDEVAHAAGIDPYQFRRRHLANGSPHQKVLDEAALRAGWNTPLSVGRGRGIAIVESFGTIVAEVVEASLGDNGKPIVHRVTAVVDCGTVVDPRNAEAQVQGAILMGLSAAIGEAITIENGAVVQRNFHQYPILGMAATPPVIAVHFLTSDRPIGGLGEPGLPPAAPALANALFAATGRRIRELPISAKASAPVAST
jgi:isoquinoline 1-oxidoreductase subunit beta